MKKVVLIITLLFITSTTSALKREVKIPNSLGLIATVEKNNNRATWNLYGSERYESVLLFRLNLAHAKKLLQAANQADAFYKEIDQSGKCPTSTVKSGYFGEIRKGSYMKFEVICKNNRNSLQILMSDKYVVNLFTIKAKPIQVRQLAQRLIKELGGKPSSVAVIKQQNKSGAHSHNGRSHSHPLPAQGVKHRHGNGAIGK